MFVNVKKDKYVDSVQKRFDELNYLTITLHNMTLDFETYSMNK